MLLCVWCATPPYRLDIDPHGRSIPSMCNVLSHPIDDLSALPRHTREKENQTLCFETPAQCDPAEPRSPPEQAGVLARVVGRGSPWVGTSYYIYGVYYKHLRSYSLCPIRRASCNINAPRVPPSLRRATTRLHRQPVRWWSRLVAYLDHGPIARKCILMAGITRDWELVLKSWVSSSWETFRREQGSRMKLCGFLCMRGCLARRESMPRDFEWERHLLISGICAPVLLDLRGFIVCF